MATIVIKILMDILKIYIKVVQNIQVVTGKSRTKTTLVITTDQSNIRKNLTETKIHMLMLMIRMQTPHINQAITMAKAAKILMTKINRNSWQFCFYLKMAIAIQMTTLIATTLKNILQANATPIKITKKSLIHFQSIKHNAG